MGKWSAFLYFRWNFKKSNRIILWHNTQSTGTAWVWTACVHLKINMFYGTTPPEADWFHKTEGPDEVILGLLTVQRVSATNVRVAQTIFRQTLKK